MTQCEICGRRPEVCCSGLDVPMLFFCAEHGREHERICPEVLAGRSRVERCGEVAT